MYLGFCELGYLFEYGNKGQNNSYLNEIEAYSSLSSHKSSAELDKALSIFINMWHISHG